MATLRELKVRIGSVASSEKITGAMKMISSAKMHKAEQALKKLRPFRDQIETIIANLVASDTEFSSPLMEVREVKNVALAVWGSDDGLCGAYNVNIFKQLLHTITKLQAQCPEAEITILPIGGKMAKAVGKLAMPGVKISVPEGIDSKSSGNAVRDFAWMLRDSFTQGIFDRVDLLYMSFKSVSRQMPEQMQLLPVSSASFGNSSDKATGKPYLFEPSPAIIFTRILPMYLLAIIQDVFTENQASEQAARVMAMQSANDNAKKLRDQLNLEYNKLRQQAITTELLDILGGQVR